MADRTIIDYGKIKEQIPLYVKRVADVLISNGFEAFLVGGSVRDMLIGKSPVDYDIATDCMPNKIKKLFPKTVATGAKFGTIVVVMEDQYAEPYNVEVTTYRSESEYVGSRWPSKVEFGTSIKEDLKRRDFTINALAIDLEKLELIDVNDEELVVDYFGGIRDLDKKIIRAVGDPMERFEEDALRLFRACRFASQLGFAIETKTFHAIKQLSYTIDNISVERLREEFEKLLFGSARPSVGIELLRKSGLLGVFLPELEECVGVTQPEYHVDDVYTHTLKTIDRAQDEVKLAALFHDIGKPKTISVDESGTHFYQHDVVGAKIARNVMKRMRFPNVETERVVNLVRHHMFYYPSADWRKGREDKFEPETIERLEEEAKSGEKNVGGWSDAAIRRFIKRIGGVENVDDLIKLRIADATANPKSTFTNHEIEALQTRISKVLAEDSALRIKDLDISGHDLIEMGIPKGPQIREALEYLLEEVLEDPKLNQKELLLKLVSEKFSELN